MSERDQFEAAWRKEYPLHGAATFKRSGFNPDAYVNTRVQDGWLMWQARAAASAQPAASGATQAPFSNCRFQICDLPGQCRGEGKCHHPAVPSASAQATDSVPTERGIYAWVAEGSASLVLVHTRPSVHSPGGVLKASVIKSSEFYDGCPVDQWTGGRWFGPLRKDATPPSPDAREAGGGGDAERRSH